MQVITDYEGRVSNEAVMDDLFSAVFTGAIINYPKVGAHHVRILHTPIS